MKRFRAPGRVNLIGEHTDYAGGPVLPVAIDRAITVACVPSARLELHSAEADAAPYVAAVEAELAALGRPPAGVEGEITSDLPIGAGLSSSAALEVAVAAALCDAASFALAPAALINACRRAELRAVGVPCGPMDQAASLLARAGHALLLDCATLEYEHVPVPADVAIVVIDSGVRRRLSDTRYAELEDAIAHGRAGRRHVPAENARVLAAAAALRRGDAEALGPILAAGHASLRDDLGVSTPELDLLVALALEAGAFAARMTGAGFGGSIVALAPAGDAVRVAATAAAAYTERTGRSTDPLVTRPSDGLLAAQYQALDTVVFTPYKVARSRSSCSRSWGSATAAARAVAVARCSAASAESPARPWARASASCANAVSQSSTVSAWASQIVRQRSAWCTAGSPRPSTT